MMDRALWLAERRLGLGGTDVAAILGLSSWGGPWDVWADKVGLLTDDTPQTDEQEWGHLLEEPIAQRWARKHAPQCARLVEPWSLEHPDHTWLRGNPDRLVVVGEAPVGILEVKTADGAKAREWGDDGEDAGEGTVPPAYRVQLQCYVTIVRALQRCGEMPGDPISGGWFAASIAGRYPRSFRYLHDPELEALILTEGERFWTDHVLTRVPPPVDARCGAGLAALYPHVTQKDPAALSEELLAEAVAAAAALKEAEARSELARNAVKAALGAAGKGAAGRYTASWSECKGRVSLDVGRVEAEYPEVYRACARQSAGYRMLRVTERKESKRGK